MAQTRELLPTPSRDKYLYASILPSGVWPVWLTPVEPIRLHELILPDSFSRFYFCGIGGTLTIVFLCKILRHTPIAYFGRFSIIVFGTQRPFIIHIGTYLRAFFPRRKPPLRTYFRFDDDNRNRRYRTAATICPRFTAQKECISTARFTHLIAPLAMGPSNNTTSNGTKDLEQNRYRSRFVA